MQIRSKEELQALKTQAQNLSAQDAAH
jgi:hypothetical protein